MSLKKLFNLDYFMQNIKKSKLAIVLFLLVVPIFTSLLIITSGNGLFEDGFIALGGFNIFFMYITPFILSLSLFGYVYKKRSADFMGSMPISRKSVFATNTIGGILLIVLMQFITMVCTFLLFVVTKSTIFPMLVFEIFLYQTIAYIFVYTVCNLAMSVSGNFVTQIVVILLILFVIPASMLFFHANHWNSDILVDGTYEYGHNLNIQREFNFTAPSLLTNGNYFFNAVSVEKMLILSILYIALGYFAFEHKKLEAAGESFEKLNVHFLVKGLTLIPFAMLLVVLIDEEVWEAVLFLIAIVAVYYLVYDLLTNKKTKFWINMASMFISLVMLFGIYRVLFEIGENVQSKLDINDVKSYYVTGVGYTDFYLSDEKLTDIDFLKKIIAERNENDWNSKNSVTFRLNLKSGARAKMTVYSASDKNVKELFSLALAKKIPTQSILKFQGVAFSKSQTNEMIQEINDYIEKEGLASFYQKVGSSESRYMYVYTFANHEILNMGIPINLTEHLFQTITQVMNTRTINAISRNQYRGYYLNIVNPSVLKNYLGDIYYYGDAPEEIIQLILNSSNKPCSMEKEYVILRLGEYEFYTNEIEQVAKIMKEHGTKQDLEYYPYDEAEGYVPYYEKEGSTLIEPIAVDLTMDENSKEIVIDEPVLESI